MLRKVYFIPMMVLTLLSLCLSACLGPSSAADVSTVKHPQLPPLPASFPKIDRHPDLMTFKRGSLSTLPVYNPASIDPLQMDLRSYDLTGMDLRNSLSDLPYSLFDNLTKWPPANKMPTGFNIEKIMASGKNPGLGIRALHAKGVTGWGVGIAIIDYTLLVDHREYSDHLRLYEEINAQSTGSVHGTAVAAIAVGKTVGVAPDADLYYIASSLSGYGEGNRSITDLSYYAQAVRRTIDVNQQLPESRKIHVIAMEVGWLPEDKGYADILAAVNEAKAAGIFVITSNLEQTYGLKFQGLGRDPMADPDQFTSYQPGIWWANDFFSGGQFSVRNQLLVPMDSRTMASPTGVNDYFFSGVGGWSFSIPYIAGMYALACQVDPTITPEHFWELAMQTGRTIQIEHNGKQYSFGVILDPLTLIAAIQK
jgi:hypothetical protein